MSKVMRKKCDGNKKISKKKEKKIMTTKRTGTKGNKGTKNEMIEACGMTKDQMINEMKKINSKHSDNMDSRKSALKILMSVIPVGDKVFVMVPVEDLYIDDSYQRPVQNHAQTIAQEWDDMKCDPLKINYRENGKLYVWDGQHRLIALFCKRKKSYHYKSFKRNWTQRIRTCGLRPERFIFRRQQTLHYGYG